MATRTRGGMFGNQNLNVHYTEASVGSKTNIINKASKKGGGGLGGRKPLGDLSNSLKPSVNQTSNKECIASQASLVSQKKSVSNASMKLRPSGRKALCDISNSRKTILNEVSKKNYNAPTIVPEEIAEERCLHNHAECIKAQRRSVENDEFLQIVGLDIDFSSQFAATPRGRHVSQQLKVDSPPRHLELLEMTEQVVRYQSPKFKLRRDLESPSPCRTPHSPEHFMQWTDDDNVNFKLMETPEFLKHRLPMF